MSFTHTFGVIYRTAAGQITSTTDTFSGDTELSYDGSIATGVTDQELELAFDFADVKSCVLYSTKNITLETNSASAPDDTIALTATKQRVYNTDMPTGSRLFTADVTKIFITNASGATADIKIRILIDGTP